VAEAELLVDPAVSRLKFDHEIALYHQLKDEHIRCGRWLLSADYPQVFVAFAAPQIRPHPVVFGAVIDFTNYDFWPPSVTLVNPFTRIPYKAGELPTRLPRRAPADTKIEGGTPPDAIAIQEVMQSYTPEDIPFLCLPGVREYHHHPAHTGDSWLLRRTRGEGTLYFLLEKLYRYGIASLRTYRIQASFQMQVTGLIQEEFPE
jgi:hypothetical protein